VSGGHLGACCVNLRECTASEAGASLAGANQRARAP